MSYQVLHHYTCDRCQAHVAVNQLSHEERQPRPGDPLAMRDHHAPKNWKWVRRMNMGGLVENKEEDPDRLLCQRCSEMLWFFLYQPKGSGETDYERTERERLQKEASPVAAAGALEPAVFEFVDDPAKPPVKVKTTWRLAKNQSNVRGALSKAYKEVARGQRKPLGRPKKAK